ncbi:MAG: right-handed parallel beta-helix repeat-containing protein, partial [Armatimonadota bacterium]
VNKSILDGGGSGRVVEARCGYRAGGIDGFVIRNGETGIYCSLFSPTIANNSVSVNTQYGIYCWDSSPSITNNVLSGTGPYGIWCEYYSSPSITNNVVSGNGLYGIYCYWEASPVVTNNTVVGNGTGIRCDMSSPPITNTILAFNGTGVYRSGGSPVLRSNCVYNPGGTNYSGLSAGAGDIRADPLFVNRAEGDFHLLPGSPCIDAGLDSAVPAWLLTDLDGKPRVSGTRVDIGAYESQPPKTSIADARGGTDGTPVSLRGAVVTAAWADVLYVEQPDRACAVRVEKAGHGLSVGQIASITGRMSTTADGERFVQATSVSGAPGAVLPPLDMSLRSVGGGPTADYSASGGTGQAGVIGGAGLNNIGLLVRTAGRVTFVDPGGQFFNVWDGSPVKDSEGREGVRVYAPGLTLPGAGEFVVVTGISSCVKSGQQLYPLLRVRTQGDMVAL